MNNILLHLSLISGIGPATVERLVAALPAGVLDDLYRFTARDFVERCGVSPKVAQQLATGLADAKLVDDELKLIERHRIALITCQDATYPALLKTIHLPSLVLYVRGAVPMAGKSLAVVGSRLAQTYCQKVARQVLPPLVEKGFAIVSGGALGADTIAHEVALEFGGERGGRTVAVIGAGLLKPYPAQNRVLFDKIVASGGAVISPFPLTAPAQPGNFPARNRIIAGLSHGCLVLQAAQKSGALITASCALNAGREVFAVPGPIDDPLSAGCHALLSQGAHLVSCAQDILDVFGFERMAQVHVEHGSTVAEAMADRSRQTSCIEERDPVAQFCVQPMTFDDLLEATRIEVHELHSKLCELQLEGKIEQNFAGLWQCVGE